MPINGITTSFKNVGGKDSICIGKSVTFQSTASTTPTKVIWDFGDGTSFNGLTPPAKTYASAGTYIVTMRATFGSCSDSATKTIKVYDKPVVDFYSPNDVACQGPVTVNFVNLSPDSSSSTFNWTFGDGGTGTGTDPAHIYGPASQGAFDVSLSITDGKGCTNTITKPQFVTIIKPVVTITNLPGGVCVGKPYTATSNNGAVDGVASVTWNFGDGTPDQTSPTHTYGSTGFYTLRVKIVTNGGCTATDTKVNAVQVGLPPAVDFKEDTDKVCRSGFVKFTNLTTPVTSSYVWDFGDGTTSALQDPPHKFPGIGAYTIKLTATSNGCADSVIKANFIQVLPPLANFGYTVDCLNKTTATFNDSSKTDITYGAISYLWNFDFPGSHTSTTPPPGPIFYTYPSTGSYNVQLIVTNGSCLDTITKKIQLVSEVADFGLTKTTICKNEMAHFVSVNNPANVSKFAWIVDGGVPVVAGNEYFIPFATTGIHTIQLIITDINGCTSTSAIKNDTVTGPTALFGIKNNGGCKNGVTSFLDSSTALPNTISKWFFDFGDGTSKTFAGAPFTHTYADTGTYTAILTVTDNLGCTNADTLKNAVRILKPIAFFSAAQTIICPGAPLLFTDSSSGNSLQYNWNFGDGGTDNINQNPIHAYSGSDSAYPVKLVITDKYGCTDSLTRSNYISVKSAKLSYLVKDTSSLCPPLETKFNFTGKDYESFIWDFGDGATSTLPSTSHFYNSYGQYPAKLYVTGYGGCLDSASFNITITNPGASTLFTFDPKTNCNNITANFNVFPPYGSSFTLYFGDGAADSSGNISFSHYYASPNQYNPYILLKDSTGCLLSTSYGGIDVKGAIPLFGENKNKFCDSGTVYFTDFSLQGNDPITNRNWDFGDGSPVVTNPTTISNYYKTPGIYAPSLTITATSGCVSTFTDTIRVLATPRPVITSQDAICNNVIINFSASLLVPPDTAITWAWGLGNGQTSAQQSFSVAFPDTGLHHITLRATNSAGCKGDTSKDIVVYPLPSVTVTGDTTLIAGGLGISMPVTYSANAATYNWTPATNLSCTDCANPFATPKFTTTYKVRVTDDNGCISSRNVTLIVICNNKNFFIPNTFSPNNDGANDRFYPRGTGLNLIQALRIFNRWGELVFEKRNFPANDAASGWDGSYKGKPAPSDTYIYMIDIICDNATIITYKGNVTLIR